MSRKLPEDFALHRYGIDVRLANESDSEFILSLRTNEKLSRFLHKTSNDLEKQRQWMKNYKEREERGEDYYFLYSKEGMPFGVNRIYDIKESTATGGSWICISGLMPDISVSTCIIGREILFDILQLEEERFDVRKGNKQVLKMHKMFGATIVGESDIDYFFSLKKKDFKINSAKLINLLGIH